MQIVVEGLDASGKESICSSHGEFGNDPKQMNPYAVSMLYAIDRFLSYSPADVVICDRYTSSNLIYHIANDIIVRNSKLFD